MRTICDSSTIIALERINHLWILEKFAEEILIPPAVNKELRRKKGFSPPSYFKIEEPKDRFYITQNRHYLHIGEVEVIALAKEIKVDIVVLDDKKARKFAEKEGLKVVGLIALLIMAKEKGIVKRVKPILDSLKNHSFFIGEDIYIEALMLSGEI